VDGSSGAAQVVLKCDGWGPIGIDTLESTRVDGSCRIEWVIGGAGGGLGGELSGGLSGGQKGGMGGGLGGGPGSRLGAGLGAGLTQEMEGRSSDLGVDFFLADGCFHASDELATWIDESGPLFAGCSAERSWEIDDDDRVAPGFCLD